MNSEDNGKESHVSRFKYLPLTLNLVTLGGIATPLILRGTPLPTKRSRVFSTATDNQTEIEIDVVLGESPLVKRNLAAVKFNFEGIPKYSKGIPQLNITITIDQECIISALAVEMITGRKLSSRITQKQIFLTDQQIKDIIRQSELHKEDDTKESNYIEEKQKSTALIITAERLLHEYQSLLGEKNCRILEKNIAELGVALQENNKSNIHQLNSTLEQSCMNISKSFRVSTPFDDNFSDFFSNVFGSPYTTKRQPASPKTGYAKTAVSAKAESSHQRKQEKESAKPPSTIGTKSEIISILAIFANPRGSDPLRLSTEDRIIHECLKLSRYREKINIDVLHAATIHDLRRALLEKDFRIIHFSGHGTGIGLAFENELGKLVSIEHGALTEFLSSYSPPIECVLLNACYTGNKLRRDLRGIPYTIGMNGALSDEGASEFSRGFYDAIGAGKSIEFAYQEGCRTMKLLGLSDSILPILIRGN